MSQRHHPDCEGSPCFCPTDKSAVASALEVECDRQLRRTKIWEERYHTLLNDTEAIKRDRDALREALRDIRDARGTAKEYAFLARRLATDALTATGKEIPVQSEGKPR